MPKRILLDPVNETFVVEEITYKMAEFMERVHIEWDNRPYICTFGPYTKPRKFLKAYAKSIMLSCHPVEVKVW